MDGGAWPAPYSPGGPKELDTTYWLNHDKQQLYLQFIFPSHVTWYAFTIFKAEPWTSLFLSPEHYYSAQAAVETSDCLEHNGFPLPWLSEAEVQDQSAGRFAFSRGSSPTLQAATCSLASHGLFSVCAHSWALSGCITSLHKTIIPIGSWPTAMAFST